jgi:antirestriction protein ArdC
MNVYDVITSRILENLDKGVIPWRKPWVGGGAPKNFVSKKEYRGINVWLLSSGGFTSPYWLTFKQAGDAGGHIRKGEHGSPCIFWKFRDAKEDDAAEDRPAPILRYYTVFNLSQCEGIADPDPVEAFPVDPIPAAEGIVTGYTGAPPVTHKGGRACYSPMIDTVSMPARESFPNQAEYYSTLFHEFGHSTGHESRLNRKGADAVAAFGGQSYSREELVAEMAAAYLCGTAGIENATLENSAAYIAGWRSHLKSDPKCVIIAAAQGQKAADWILGKREG